MPVVGSRVAILPHRAAELRHGQHDDVPQLLSQVLRKRGERLAELREPCRELSFARPLVHMSVPAGHVGERQLQPDVGLDELGDLQHRLAEPAARVVGTICRLVLARVHLLQHLDGLECLL